jgi:magnesium chelatase subunit D
MSNADYDFPLAALVGQEQLKTALLLCAVNPSIGGILIRGDKGSAKSTAARGLAAVMAPVERVVGCVYNCEPSEPAPACGICSAEQRSLETKPVPFVNLPLGASEDRVLGSLDFERALKDGVRAFQPGLLASAHRGILYIDEVNLLPDHLVDVLLDAAAMGVNRVQREGLSLQHPARIALLGTMNQEEGELRPQLLDRFGMMVDVRAPLEPGLRIEIVRRRLSWEADPETFNEAWQPGQRALRERVLRAQALLPRVVISDGLLMLISELCCSQGVTSLRADLVMNKAARALAALNGRVSVHPEDLAQTAPLVLPHRRRAKPFEQPGLDEKELQRFLRKATASAGDSAQSCAQPPEHLPGGDPGTGKNNGSAPADGTDTESDHGAGQSREHAGEHDPGDVNAREHARGNTDSGGTPDGDKVSRDGNAPSDEGESRVQVFAPGAIGPAPRIEVRSASFEGVVGRRSASVDSRRGREVRAVPDERPTDLAVTATLHHALLRTGGRSPEGRLQVARRDFHQKVKAGRQGNLILFMVDASGSMAALSRMQMVKGTVLSLLRDAYQRRDEVGVIAFRGPQAEVLLSPTRSVEAAERQLRELPTGGRTPLAHALSLAHELLSRPSSVPPPEPLLIVLSDGRANVSLDGQGDPWQQSLECAHTLAKKHIAGLVLDTEAGYLRTGRARQLAAALGTQCLSVEEFNSESLGMMIRGLP